MDLTYILFIVALLLVAVRVSVKVAKPQSHLTGAEYLLIASTVLYVYVVAAVNFVAFANNVDDITVRKIYFAIKCLQSPIRYSMRLSTLAYYRQAFSHGAACESIIGVTIMAWSTIFFAILNSVMTFSWCDSTYAFNAINCSGKAEAIFHKITLVLGIGSDMILLQAPFLLIHGLAISGFDAWLVKAVCCLAVVLIPADLWLYHSQTGAREDFSAYFGDAAKQASLSLLLVCIPVVLDLWRSSQGGRDAAPRTSSEDLISLLVPFDPDQSRRDAREEEGISLEDILNPPSP